MTRSAPSLRTRVAVAAALGTTVVVVLVAVLAVVLLGRAQHTQLDQRLASVAEVLTPAGTAPRGWAVTQRSADGTVVGVRGPELPAAPAGYATLTVQGRSYRVLTTTATGGTVSLAAPTASTRAAVDELRRAVLAVALGAVALAAALGWVFAGRAVRPLRRLARDARAVGTGSTAGPDRVHVRGAREAEELAAEINGMLGRLHEAQQRTDAALATARDFAATAQHELRTPLTALRTDLDVLGLEPGEPERSEVVADLRRSQARLQETLTALGQLASGELADGAGRTEVDMTELLHRAAEETARTDPGVEVTVAAGPPVVLTGSAAGLRLAVDNLVANSVRHGRAGRVRLGVTRDGAEVVLTVDDDGTGVPVDERRAVFTRFVRGHGAASPGSGLGLALVEQQAMLHGGRAWLAQSPWGGARVVLVLAG